MLSPERDNYRFLVLWEELDNTIQLSPGDILRDCEGWMAANDAAKAAASAAAEARAADEAKVAIETKAACRAEAEAEAEAAAAQLRHRFLTVQQELENTQKELEHMRLRVAAVVCEAAVTNCPSNLAIDPSDVLFGSWAAIERGLGAAADSALALTLSQATPAPAAAGNLRDAAVDLTAQEELPKDAQPQHIRSLLANAVVAADAHAVAAAYKQRRQQSAALRYKSSDNGGAS